MSKFYCGRVVLGFLFVLLLTNINSCKNNISKLASDDVGCTPAKLGKLKEELLTISRQDPDASLQLTRDGDSEALISVYTYNYYLQRYDFDAAIAKAPAEGWQLHMANGCLQYAKKEAEKKCGSMGCGWFSVNPTNGNYINYRNAALTQCQNAFHSYVESKQESSKPNPPSDNGTKPDGFSDENDKNNESAKLEREKKIAALRSKIAKCEADIKAQNDGRNNNQEDGLSETQFRTKCESAGGQAVSLEPPFVCRCLHGASINPLKEVCPQLNDKPIEPVPPVVPTPAAKCECSLLNGLCSKVVDGKVVDFLTPIFNTVTGKQETCVAGGGGGYDNLCNQSKLKCP